LTAWAGVQHQSPTTSRYRPRAQTAPGGSRTFRDYTRPGIRNYSTSSTSVHGSLTSRMLPDTSGEFVVAQNHSVPSRHLFQCNGDPTPSTPYTPAPPSILCNPKAFRLGGDTSDCFHGFRIHSADMAQPHSASARPDGLQSTNQAHFRNWAGYLSRNGTTNRRMLSKSAPLKRRTTHVEDAHGSWVTTQQQKQDKIGAFSKSASIAATGYGAPLRPMGSPRCKAPQRVTPMGLPFDIGKNHSACGR